MLCWEAFVTDKSCYMDSSNNVSKANNLAHIEEMPMKCIKPKVYIKHHILSVSVSQPVQ